MKVYRIQHIESGLFHTGSSYFAGNTRFSYRTNGDKPFNTNERGQVYTRLQDVKSVFTRGSPVGYRVVEYELNEGKEVEL